ncbi:nitroreductase family protein [Virgisporangium aliadipatigenens]|uniref:Nitroreductase family protein n=1 Tax=Virgisporangium aliadipatigenens TaxID=741659 RepID=A0A8J3YEJ3_9ACTN|nr:nitroreductase family protein [Virgisporangium aliadipatigenens]GIJ43561.1 nitroreductase family protein [Virgisporangium aliadipatigenens]
MEFDQLVRRRRMVRRYDPNRPVPQPLVDKLLGHAVRAPSGGFSQGWEFLVIRKAEDLESLWKLSWNTRGDSTATEAQRRSEAYRARGFWVTAPLVIWALSDRDRYLDRYAQGDKGWTDRSESRWPAAYWDMDAGAATLMMHLTALNEGLASCYIGLSPKTIPEFKDTFGIPDRLHPVVGLTIGYADEDEPPRDLSDRRRPLGDMVHEGRWSDPATR